jgi:hypothetical protein
MELGGPAAISPLEVVRTFERATGRRFDVQHVPEPALEQQQLAAEDPLGQSFAALMRGYARGDTIDMHATLAVFPKQLTSVQEFAHGMASGPRPLGIANATDATSPAT